MQCWVHLQIGSATPKIGSTDVAVAGDIVTGGSGDLGLSSKRTVEASLSE